MIENLATEQIEQRLDWAIGKRSVEQDWKNLPMWNSIIQKAINELARRDMEKENDQAREKSLNL
jgi:hypothetical protein